MENENQCGHIQQRRNIVCSSMNEIMVIDGADIANHVT